MARPAVVVGLGLLCLSTGCCTFSTPAYRGPRSGHFDGQTFFNPGVDRNHDVAAALRWAFSREPGPWPEAFDAKAGDKPPERVGLGKLRVTFVNHATVLIQVDGLNILTDPVWSERIGPWGEDGPGLDRVRPPGIRFEDLPPIDLVLISHNHYDHMDLPTLQRLGRTSVPRIAVGLGGRRYLESRGVHRARDFDWWDSYRVSNTVRIVSVPAQHFSRRGMCDGDSSLWTGWVLTTSAGNIFFAGDTGYGPHFSEIRQRLGPTRIAILPIGAYQPKWFMGPIHLSPADAVQAHQDLDAQHSLAIHFGTFQLADDGFDDPPQALARAMKEAGLRSTDFWVMGFGEGRNVASAEPIEWEAKRLDQTKRRRAARSCTEDLATLVR